MWNNFKRLFLQKSVILLFSHILSLLRRSCDECACCTDCKDLIGSVPLRCEHSWGVNVSDGDGDSLEELGMVSDGQRQCICVLYHLVFLSLFCNQIVLQYIIIIIFDVYRVIFTGFFALILQSSHWLRVDVINYESNDAPTETVLNTSTSFVPNDSGRHDGDDCSGILSRMSVARL